MNFPIQNPNQQKGREGEARFADYVTNTLKCIYHKIDGSDDFGIDGHIELVTNSLVTGKFVAIQVKHGNSYFSQETPTGHKFIANDKYLNYYLNSPVPVFIIVMNDDFSLMRWVQFDIKNILPSGKNSWWIEIPTQNNLSTNFKEQLFSSVGPIYDYSSLIKNVYRQNKIITDMLNDVDYIAIAVSKDEIELFDFSRVAELFERLSSNNVLRNRFRSSCSFFFPDYYDDPREISEIPEIMRWLKESLNNKIPWIYFLHLSQCSSLPLLLHSYVSPVSRTLLDGGGAYVEYDAKEVAKFMEIAFANLNAFTNKYDISNETNKEIYIYDWFDSISVIRFPFLSRFFESSGRR